ncbi:MAG: hypothetical protein P8J33_08250 [Pirellulaceae bacterium]|nr:hypothetical protein [Pirellulaceae bacterium]
MDIDIYKACPCQSGKKIKFCCSKDILPDLNQVLTLHRSKQASAALEKLSRLLEKHGPKACLLGLQTHVLLHSREYERAEEANDQFLQLNPRNTLGYQHKALLCAAEGRAADAVDALQTGLDACTNLEVPVTMATAFRTVGMLLMSQGQVVAGRAHLIFASELKSGEDDVSAQLIMQSFRSPEIPLLLKSEFPVPAPESDGESWTDKFLNAWKFASVGRWRAARFLAEKLNAANPGHAEIVYAIAIWSLYLADGARSELALQHYSELDSLDFDRAVEALATRFAIDDEPITGAYDFVKIYYSLDDVEQLSEKSIASQRLITGSIFSHSFVDPQAPPPQSGFLLLDVDEVRQVADAEGDAYPIVIGELLVYGRQTDRDPRVDFFIIRDADYDQTLTHLHAVLGDTLVERIDEQVVEQISILDHEMIVKWHLPPDMSIEERHAFVQRQRDREYLEKFPTIPFRVLDGQTPAEVAGDENGRRNLAALVLMVEQGADALASDGFDFNRLRGQLNVPEPQAVDLESREFDRLSPIEMQRVDFSTLPDESLIKAYVMASSCGNLPILRAAGPVILSRPDMEKYIRFEMILVMLARMCADTDEALELMQKARKHATSAQRPIGGLLIDELELRLERNRPEGCQELLRVLQASHLQDPQNQYRLASVLQRFGIMGQDGRMRTAGAGPAEPVAAAAGGSEIWTPDSGPDAAGDAEGTSKLWVPE